MQRLWFLPLGSVSYVALGSRRSFAMLPGCFLGSTLLFLLATTITTEGECTLAALGLLFSLGLFLGFLLGCYCGHRFLIDGGPLDGRAGCCSGSGPVVLDIVVQVAILVFFHVKLRCFRQTRPGGSWLGGRQEENASLACFCDGHHCGLFLLFGRGTLSFGICFIEFGGDRSKGSHFVVEFFPAHPKELLVLEEQVGSAV